MAETEVWPKLMTSLGSKWIYIRNHCVRTLFQRGDGKEWNRSSLHEIKTMLSIFSLPISPIETTENQNKTITKLLLDIQMPGPWRLRWAGGWIPWAAAGWRPRHPLRSGRNMAISHSCSALALCGLNLWRAWQRVSHQGISWSGDDSRRSQPDLLNHTFATPCPVAGLTGLLLAFLGEDPENVAKHCTFQCCMARLKALQAPWQSLPAPRSTSPWLESGATESGLGTLELTTWNAYYSFKPSTLTCKHARTGLQATQWNWPAHATRSYCSTLPVCLARAKGQAAVASFWQGLGHKASPTTKNSRCVSCGTAVQRLVCHYDKLSVPVSEH